MRTNAIIRIILFVFLIILLLGILAVGIGAYTFSFLPGWFSRWAGYDAWGDDALMATVAPDGSGDASVAIPADAIKALDIQWVSGSITIETADTDEITISEPAGLTEDEQLRYRVSGDRLIIAFCREKFWSSHFFSFGTNFGARKHLVVTVPQDWDCRELSIDAVSADCTISNLSIGELEMDNVSGTYRLNDLNCQEVSFDTTSGGITYTGTLTYFDCDSVSGDCALQLSNTPRKVSHDAVSGDCILTLPEDAGFTAELDSLSGQLSSEFKDSVTRNGKLIRGDESCEIDSDTMSGDLTLKVG